MDSKIKYLLYSLYALLIYFTLFHHIGRHPIKTWDESLFACRALYMADNNAYMPNFNVLDKVLPDHRNTKPPFSTWIQAASFKIFGLSEQALRIPMGIILILCFLHTINFSRRQFHEPMYGILLSIILLTSVGFMRDHMARFGDQDVAFAAYSFLSILFFYLFCEYDKLKDLALFTFFSIAALLTKNLLSLVLIPGFILYALYKKKLLMLLRRSSTYVAAFALLASYIFTILFLENAYPGFFERMWDYELFGRYNKTIEGHSGGFFYVLDIYFSDYYSPWFVFAWTIPFIFFNKENSKKKKDLAVCMLLCYLSYFVIVSLSSTKTAWYFAPLYMISSYLIAMGMVNIYHMLRSLNQEDSGLKYTMLIMFIFLTAYAFYNVLNKVSYNPESEVKDEQYVLFLEHVERTKPSLKQFSIIDNNFGASPYFYSQMFNRNKDYEITVKRGGDRDKGEIVMVCLNNAMNPIKRRYHVNMIDSFKYCRLMEIGEEKKE